MSTGPTSAETALLESPRLLTVEDYRRMIAAGILDEHERVELLEGVIVTMTPQGPTHAHCIEWLNWYLAPRIGPGYRLRPQLPLTLGDRSEPEPDLAVVGAGSSSATHHPGAAVLVIEVAGDSLRKDRIGKGALYARHGVREYWVVNVEARGVDVFTDPDAAGGAYRRSRSLATGDVLTSEAFPDVSFPVAELFR